MITSRSRCTSRTARSTCIRWRQRYRPLADLAERWPVVILSRQATGAEKLIEEGAGPVAFVPTVRNLEKFLAKQDIRIVLYVNQNTRNFQMFRYGRRWHVFINHGESDKMYMSHQPVQGLRLRVHRRSRRDERDRLSRTLWDYDIDRRAIEIGRPQADHYSGTLPYTPDERTVVLSAPTWEGDPPQRALRLHRHARREARGGAPRHRAPPRHLPPASAQRRRGPRVRGGPPPHHRGHRGGELGGRCGAARVRRRAGAGLAARRGGGRRGRRHLGDGLRPAGIRAGR